MLTVGGLLLGAVLTTPAAATNAGSDGVLASPFAHRGPTVGPDVALGLRDPFEPGRAIARHGSTGRGDLRDPFGTAPRSRMAGPAQPVPTDLRSPFVIAPPTESLAVRPHDEADLRDPFDR